MTLLAAGISVTVQGPAPRATPACRPAPALTDAAYSNFIRGLFVTYSEVLRRYIRRRVRNEADVAELVQDVYLRLMNRNGAERLHQAPESYLFRTAINVIRDRHRRNTARSADRHVAFDDEFATARAGNPETLLASRQLSRILLQSISELSPSTREVFLLRLIYELSYRDIAARTRIPLRSIERYMSQAMGYCCAKVAQQL
jgi:RNA polymerase sigma-70 factor (ECF subfamily)